MEFLVISNIVLWIIVVIQGLVIFALTRQIGVLFERVAPAGALSVNKAVQVGQSAPEMTLPSFASGMVDIGGQPKDHKSQLLVFVSPDCPVCKTLMPAIKSSAAAESDWINVVFASDGDEQDHQRYIKDQGIGSHPYVVSELLGKTYGVSKLPYAVLIDDKGKIASMGIINSREHLDSLFEAKERRVASIQDYMQSKNSVDDLAFEAK